MNLIELAGVAGFYAYIGLAVMVGPITVGLAAADVRRHPHLPVSPDVEQLELEVAA